MIVRYIVNSNNITEERKEHARSTKKSSVAIERRKEKSNILVFQKTKSINYNKQNKN